MALLTATGAMPLSAGVKSTDGSKGKTYYMRVENPDDPESTISFTDLPDRYDRWNIFIKTGKSRSGARFRDYIKNFRLYDDEIRALGKEHAVHPALIKAVVMAESAFNPGAESRAGAQGLMQLIPGTQRLVGCSDPWDPKENLGGGTRYLKQMLKRFDGSTRLAVAAYNAGPGAVERYKGIPPFQETQAYVRRVESLFDEFRQNDLSFEKR